MLYREQNRGRFFVIQMRRLGTGQMWRTCMLLAAATCALLTTGCDRGDHPARLGSPAPQFTVSDGTHTVSLSSLRGHVVVLNFWASWCVPCIEEAPSLVEMQRRLPQVMVVAISADQDAAAYRQFVRDNRMNFATVRDPSMWVQAVYGTVKIPDTYVIDREGILRRKFVSAQNWTDPEILGYLGKL